MCLGGVGGFEGCTGGEECTRVRKGGGASAPIRSGVMSHR